MRIKKFNSGLGAILCNSCRVIVLEGRGINITEEEWESNEPLYCEKCKIKKNEEDNKIL